MNATELRAENERLRKQLAEMRCELTHSHTEVAHSQAQLAHIRNRFEEAQAQHEAVTAQFTQTLEEKDRQVASLEHQIKLLLQRIRGSRQERIDPDQLLLFSLEELEELGSQLEQGSPEEDLIDEDLIDEGPSRKRRRKSPGRVGPLPSHLEREVVRHELSPAERACPCCGELRQEIGIQSSEQLELIPARLKVVQHDRVKYACPRCEEHVAIASKPPQPIEKGLPGPGLCAHTVLSKFGDHQPLYRQEDVHSRLGMTIRRSTLCGWQAALAELAKPLVGRMKFLLLQSKAIHTDDTSIKMLEPGRGVTRTCKFWPYLGDWLHPYAVYDFTLSRERDGPARFLDGFRGYLQADAYSGYDSIYAGELVWEVACWIHARRYWHQALDNDPVRANRALGFIARLSQIETQLLKAFPPKNLQGERDFAAVAAGRQQHAMPILAEFQAWLERESQDGRILPKSPIRAAFTYTLNQWDALCRYTQEGYLSYDNNIAERLVKIPATGRKNYLFVGSKRGGEGAAVMYSLVSSAKANGVEPFAWLRDLFTRLPFHRTGEAFAQSAAGEAVTSSELDDLLPDRWLQSHPNCVWTIDVIRRAERCQKNQARRRRRSS
ncbi:MAG TPA: IS66 family transposase [Thermoguttaceae bacterium]|nr:IS66 family transposase [Thermoguttaceae bacterium]